MSRAARLAIVAGSASLLLLGAAVVGTRPGRALVMGNRGLGALEQEPRVRYEPGASDAAAQIAGYLPAAIERVENRLGARFPAPVQLLVFADQESFNTRMGAAPEGRATGAVFAARVLLSPRAFELAVERNVLVHELTHLHFIQHLGGTATNRRIPRWFQEGLAVHVAADAGLDPFAIGRDQALAAIRAGDTFTPETSGRWLRPRTASDFGLDLAMFYRQAQLLTAHLEATNPTAFAQLLRSLRDGNDLSSVTGLYGLPIAALFRELAQ